MTIPVTPRSVGLMLAASVFAGWFDSRVAPELAPSLAPAQQSIRSQGRQGRSAELTTFQPAPETARLRAWLDARPEPARGRNPFVYGARGSAARPVAREEAVVAAPEPLPVPVAAPTPVFKLSGIASNTEHDVVTMTAIMIDNGSMMFVKAGDTLSGGYSVVKVDEMSVTLVDATGVTLTIRLP